MFYRNDFIFIVAVLALLLFAFGCKPREIQMKEQDPEALLREFEERYENKLSIPPQEITFAYINKEFDVSLKGEIDLQAQQAGLDYQMQNRKETPETFTFRNPVRIQDSMQIRISSNDKKPFRFREQIDIRKVSENTKYFHMSPYLMIRKENEPYKILFGNYDIDLKVKFPEGARIIRSTIPLEMVNSNTAAWQMEKLDVLPPIDIWYSLSEEKVELKKEAEERNGAIIIHITVSNVGDSSARGLKLSCKVPNTFAVPIPEQSEGSFELSQGVMHIWRYNLPALGPQSSRQVALAFQATSSGAPFQVPKIVVHNAAGDLLAVK